MCVHSFNISLSPQPVASTATSIQIYLGVHCAGTGKTLIARQIGRILNGREPKVVNGPEVLSKYVGQAEEAIRGLFAQAEAEQKERGPNSGLHVIIFDELDAICRRVPLP